MCCPGGSAGSTATLDEGFMKDVEEGIARRKPAMGIHRLGVILDSSVVIEAERQRLNAAEFLKRIVQAVGEREAALSSITVAELAHGICRANTLELRDRRRAFLNELKAAVPVYSITDNTAELIGKIGGSRRPGVSIPFDDLLIGACALNEGMRWQPESAALRRIPGLALVQM